MIKKNMNTWSFYDRATGLFAGRIYSGPDDCLGMNTSDGFVAIEGMFDRHTQRFDIERGEVIEDLSLSAGRDQFERRQRALTHIAELERRQLRPTRELAIDPSNESARERVQAIEAQIAGLRAQLQ